MRRVRPWLLPLWAAVLAALSAPSPVRACLYAEPELLPVGFFDEKGLPKAPTIASGASILVKEVCSYGACMGVTKMLTILDGSGMELPIRVDELPKNESLGYRLWRVQPESPLAAGQYTLKTYFLSMVANGSMPQQHEYTFVVGGTASDSPTVVFEIAPAPNSEGAYFKIGKGFECQPINTSCGPQIPPPATTQRRRMLYVSAQRFEVPASEVGQFLYRIVATEPGADPDRAQYWFDGSGYDPAGMLAVEYREARAEYCVELQALRVRDLELQSLGKHCVKYTLRTEPDPTWFTPCQADPNEYARAYCTENAAACSASNALAKDPAIEEACEHYSLVCAPFIGNRSPRDRPGCGP